MNMKIRANIKCLLIFYGLLSIIYTINHKISIDQVTDKNTNSQVNTMNLDKSDKSSHISILDKNLNHNRLFKNDEYYIREADNNNDKKSYYEDKNTNLNQNNSGKKANNNSIGINKNNDIQNIVKPSHNKYIDHFQNILPADNTIIKRARKLETEKYVNLPIFILKGLKKKKQKIVTKIKSSVKNIPLVQTFPNHNKKFQGNKKRKDKLYQTQQNKIFNFKLLYPKKKIPICDDVSVVKHKPLSKDEMKNIKEKFSKQVKANTKALNVESQKIFAKKQADMAKLDKSHEIINEIKLYLDERIGCQDWKTAEKTQLPACFSFFIDGKRTTTGECRYDSKGNMVGFKAEQENNKEKNEDMTEEQNNVEDSDMEEDLDLNTNEENNWNGILKSHIIMHVIALKDTTEYTKLKELQAMLILGDTIYTAGIPNQKCFFEHIDKKVYVYYMERKPFASFYYLTGNDFKNSKTDETCKNKTDVGKLPEYDIYRISIAIQILNIITYLYNNCFTIIDFGETNFSFIDPFYIRLTNLEKIEKFCNKGDKKLKFYEGDGLIKDPLTNNPNLGDNYHSRKERDPVMSNNVEKYYNFSYSMRLSNLNRNTDIFETEEDDDKVFLPTLDKTIEIINKLFQNSDSEYTKEIYKNCVKWGLYWFYNKSKGKNKFYTHIDKTMQKMTGYLRELYIHIRYQLHINDEPRLDKFKKKDKCNYFPRNWLKRLYDHFDQYKNKQKIKDEDMLAESVKNYRLKCYNERQLEKLKTNDKEIFYDKTGITKKDINARNLLDHKTPTIVKPFMRIKNQNKNN